MAAKIRIEYDDLTVFSEGVLDRRGRKGLADVPVHFSAVRVTVRIKTDAPQKKLDRLIELVGRYCPVDSLIKAAVPDYEVIWERDGPLP